MLNLIVLPIKIRLGQYFLVSTIDKRSSLFRESVDNKIGFVSLILADCFSSKNGVVSIIFHRFDCQSSKTLVLKTIIEYAQAGNTN
jgi:hypothetical protein